MTHLTKDFVGFYQDLARNNNRDWFHENKKRYEKEVKNPFVAFVSELIQAFQEVEPTVSMTAKEGIFRINRDIRFSKDKSPYKLHASAFISTTSRKDQNNPKGIYFEITPEHIRQYGGVYMTDKEGLYKIRQEIAANLEQFSSIVNAPEFVATFETIRGDKHKRIPKEFKEAHAQQPLIANKQYYYYTTMDISWVDSEQLIPAFIENYKVAQPMNDFLHRALNA